METNTQEQAVETTTAPEVEKLSQKDAVFNFITEALVEAGKQKIEGEPLKSLVSKDIRKVVRQRLFTSIRSGETKISKPVEDSRLKKYCSGLINNWLKKDPRFN